MTGERKVEAVTRLLRGEDLGLVSRSLGATAATRSRWCGAFLSGGEGTRKECPGDGQDRQIKRLEAKLGQMTMDGELLQESPQLQDNPNGGSRT